MNTRKTQPYRKGHAARHPGHALSAMLAGQPFHMRNPQDLKRAQQRMLSMLLKRRG